MAEVELIVETPYAIEAYLKSNGERKKLSVSKKVDNVVKKMHEALKKEGVISDELWRLHVKINHPEKFNSLFGKVMSDEYPNQN